MKKIFIASDHAGYNLKSSIISKFKKINDLGPKSKDSVDYPDFAKKLSKKVASNKGSFGILICGSGMGMAIAANKNKNIRAALCYSKKNTKLSKKYKLGRVRLLLKEPRSTLSWHRDPEPRLHIPIYTNPGAIMVIDKRAQHMPADGSVWVTNNLKYHNAFNGGEENRVHLVACVLDYKFN